MNVNKNRLISQGRENLLDQANVKVSSSNHRKGNGEKRIPKGTLFTGNKEGTQADRITEKKSLARKQALKTILDQLAKDSNMDDRMVDRRKHQSTLSKEASKAQEQLDHLKELEEQYKDVNGAADKEDVTLKEYDKMKKVWKMRVEEANAGITGENRAIESVKLAKLKTHPMIDAQIEEENILEEASKDIADLILADAKDQVDESIRKKQKEAEEKAENEKDEEHRTEPATKPVEPKNAKKLQEAEEQQHRLKTEIKNIIKKNKVTDEDIKGLLLDEQR